MNLRTNIYRFMRFAPCLIAFVAWTQSSVGAEQNITVTNWTERWITNVIEVRIPKNVFVDEFRTNWVEQTLTNVVTLYETNWLPKYVTNTVPVDATRLVEVTNYRTNWIVQNNTNWITLNKTNWTSLTETNEVAVDAVQTNLITLYQTNWKSLTLTNFATVLVLRTNWVSQPVTNVVQLDLGPNGSATAAVKPVPQSKPAKVEPASPAPAPVPVHTDSLAIDARGTARPLAKNIVAVKLGARWISDPAASVNVQQWRVEWNDGAILCFAQDHEFNRELPIGTYKIEITARGATDNSLVFTRAVLSVTPDGAIIQPKLTASK